MPSLRVRINLLTNLRRRFDYHFRASEQLVDAFADEDAQRRARGYLSHAFVADRLWLERIKREAQAGSTLFPDLSVAEVRSSLGRNAANYAAFLTTTNPSAISAYTTTTGTGFENTLSDVFNDVLLHGTYNCSQVASALRAAGTAPAATDYFK